MSNEMTCAKLVEIAQGPVRKILVAGGGEFVHVVALDEEGRPLSRVRLRPGEAEALVRALQQVRDA